MSPSLSLRFLGSKKGPKGSAGKKGGAPNVGTAAGGGGKDSAMPSGEFGGEQGEKSEEELMAEEAAKKAIKDKIRQEYIGALTLEGNVDQLNKAFWQDM